MNQRESTIALLGRVQSAALVAGVVGVIACVIGAQAVSLEIFLECYLYAYIFWVGVTLGCFGLTLIHHAIRGKWAGPVLRLLEAGSRNLPLMFVAFLPIAFAVLTHKLYPWAMPGRVAASHVLQVKQVYLNAPFFLVRAAIYFAVWIGLSTALNRSSLKQDETGDPALMDNRAGLGAFGILLLVLTVTFAFTDWVMSLSPEWYSTIYGIWFVVGQGLSATALTTIVIMSLKNYKPFSDVIGPRLTRDLGNVLLTFTMFWGYISLSQFLIMYSGNLPEEITYFMDRGMKPGSGPNAYWILGTFLVVFQFFVPFVCLLSGRTKREPSVLIKVAALILFVRLVDLFWTVIPFFHPAEHGRPAGLLWMAPAAVIGLGGIWMSCYMFWLKKFPLLPRHEVVPLEGALEHA